MTFENANKIFSKIKSSKLQDLTDKLVRSGIRYASIRVNWCLLSAIEKAEIEEERTIAHNAFISSCDILARNMAKQYEDNSWRKQIGNDRKEIGDFACWIHLILGLQAR